MRGRVFKTRKGNYILLVSSMICMHSTIQSSDRGSILPRSVQPNKASTCLCPLRENETTEECHSDEDTSFLIGSMQAYTL